MEAGKVYESLLLLNIEYRTPTLLLSICLIVNNHICGVKKAGSFALMCEVRSQLPDGALEHIVESGRIIASPREIYGVRVEQFFGPTMDLAMDR